jgi:hypothetical protein
MFDQRPANKQRGEGKGGVLQQLSDPHWGQHHTWLLDPGVSAISDRRSTVLRDACRHNILLQRYLPVGLYPASVLLSVFTHNKME